MGEGDRDLYVAAIIKAAEECTNADILELAYKLLIADDIQ